MYSTEIVQECAAIEMLTRNNITNFPCQVPLSKKKSFRNDPLSLSHCLSLSIVVEGGFNTHTHTHTHTYVRRELHCFPVFSFFVKELLPRGASFECLVGYHHHHHHHYGLHQQREQEQEEQQWLQGIDNIATQQDHHQNQREEKGREAKVLSTRPTTSRVTTRSQHT